MPSPFPGMDPYLEGYLWPDVHSALASKIRQILTPLLRPRYTARLAIYVIEDNSPESDIGIMYPDVEIMQPGFPRPEAPSLDFTTTQPVITPEVLSVPVVLPVEVQLTSVEIRDTASNHLISCIEILSPVNKREPGLLPYRQKRQRLYQAGVHLIEIDLIRRGTRPLAHPQIPESPYLIGVTRAHSGRTAVWPLGLRDRLPVLPIPLRPPDEDTPLDLGAALAAVYDEAAYDLSVNYAEAPPPPAFSKAELQWIQSITRT